jgi:hypothetical protein
MNDPVEQFTFLLKRHVEEIKHHIDRLGSMSQVATKQDLKEMEKRIMLVLDDLIADVTDESAVDDSIIALLNTIAAQLAAAGQDPAKLQQLKDLIDANKAKIAAAVVANTPSASPPAK